MSFRQESEEWACKEVERSARTFKVHSRRLRNPPYTTVFGTWRTTLLYKKTINKQFSFVIGKFVCRKKCTTE